MRFYTKDECEAWLRGRKRSKPDEDPALAVETLQYSRKSTQVYALSLWISTSLTYRQPALLWITEWGIWPSSENWHLYYKLRQSYGDHRLLHEAPGHLFLEHESEDLASFLQLAILNGWGGYFLAGSNHVNAFFSHDEYIDFYAERDESLNAIREIWMASDASSSSSES
jgi:hypothetical protein